MVERMSGWDKETSLVVVGNPVSLGGDGMKVSVRSTVTEFYQSSSVPGHRPPAKPGMV